MTIAQAAQHLKRNYGRRLRATDRLVGAVWVVGNHIIENSEDGDAIEVAGRTYRVQRRRSNVGSCRTLVVELDTDQWGSAVCGSLMVEPDARGYLHGDFSAPYTGAPAREFVRFANHAVEILSAFAAMNEGLAVKTEQAAANAEQALQA